MRVLPGNVFRAKAVIAKTKAHMTKMHMPGFKVPHLRSDEVNLTTKKPVKKPTK